MAVQTRQIAGTFHALGDATRLAVLEKLARESKSISELARPFDMALPSFMQHLQILEAAGLISTRKHGRVRICHFNSHGLRQTEDWLGKQRKLWERRLDQLDEYLATLKGDAT
ncbi:MAG: helix-turn-helix transcriptional regulator [Leptospiraceae bacterium]|nr:helix-turn-helix transcriptional regulator [Leptospiraceae bacterium]